MSDNLKSICDRYFKLKEELAEVAESLAAARKSISEQDDVGKAYVEEFQQLSKDEQEVIRAPVNSLVRVVTQSRRVTKRKVGKKTQVVVDEDSDVEFLGIVLHHRESQGSEGEKESGQGKPGPTNPTGSPHREARISESPSEHSSDDKQQQDSGSKQVPPSSGLKIVTRKGKK